MNAPYLIYLFLGTAIYMKAFLYMAEVIQNIEDRPSISLRYLFLQEEGFTAVKYVLYALFLYASGMAIRVALIFSPWQWLEYVGYLMGYAVPVVVALLVLLGVKKFAETTRKMSER